VTQVPHRCLRLVYHHPIADSENQTEDISLAAAIGNGEQQMANETTPHFPRC
jgi:hypothetical protein